MTAVTEGLQFSLLDGFIAQYPASGKLRESIYWLVKYRGFKKKKKGRRFAKTETVRGTLRVKRVVRL